MSRWDVLRPERPQNEQSASNQPNYRRRRRPDPSISNSSASWSSSRRPCPHWDRLLERMRTSADHVHADDVERVLQQEEPPARSLGDALMAAVRISSPRLDLALPILRKQGARLSDEQVQEFAEVLRILGGSDALSIETICYFLRSFRKQISAENAVSVFIGDRLIPCLEDHQHDNSLRFLVIETIQSLLAAEPYAQALLAPLTVDVMDRGEEEVVENPTRIRMFSALQEALSNPSLSDASMECMTTAFSCHSCSKGRLPLDLGVIDSFLSPRLQEGRDCSREMSLLKALLRAHPTSSSSLVKLFLGDSTYLGTVDGLHCTCRPRSPIMLLLHNRRRSDVIPETALQFLKCLPLEVWLGGSQMRTAPSRGRHFFGERVRDALVELFRIVQCQLSQGDSSTTKSLCQLSSSLLLDIPYHNVDDALCKIGVEFVATLAAYLVSRRDRMVPHVADTLVESMGGRNLPDGTMTAMVLPTKLWLESPLGQKFIDYVFVSLERGPNDVRLLGSVLRGAPELVLGDEAGMTRFKNIVTLYSESHSQIARLSGLDLLERALAGRTSNPDCLQTTSSACNFAFFAADISQKAVHATSASIQTAGLRCYGALSAQDWSELSEELLSDGETAFLQHIRIIAVHCAPDREERNAHVQSSACKALGDVCATYLGSSGSDKSGLDDLQVLQFADVVSGALSEALLHDDSSVHSTAIFALGNLALGLRAFMSSSACLIQPSTLRSVFHTCVDCISNENDKVAGNAIRTVGHVAYLIFHEPYRDLVETDNWKVSSACILVQHRLQRKIGVALSEANGLFKALSWKQRSVAKKHGWGACTTLALILDCDPATSDDEALGASRESLRCLVACLRSIHSINEKVSSTAIAAIRKISVLALSRISGNHGIVGDAIAVCVSQIFQEGPEAGWAKKSRLRQETELLLQHLLRAASIYDMCCVLKNEKVTTDHVNSLYGWMVEHEMSADAFESLALALQRRDLGDVRLEQKFASRALVRYRQAYTLDKVAVDGQQQLTPPDDDDEL